ncbi:NUDIX hydrolase [Kitasatospora sp. NBC_01302]|uniref:NUDIX hydrolase n=1 Tax=Kitasatospora sp. NBC_01302 TaxID=2903575 RepID=UPI002E0FC2AE|nr:NUDIX hydrolase [Kitasatospora sp. NBC_01302]
MTPSTDLSSPPEDRFPALFAPQRWEWGGIDARFAMAQPPDELITNIHLIGFTGESVVLCRDSRGHWFLPGGTREPAESVEACLARELREEAGARVLGEPLWVGAHEAVTDRAAPYRPWQPHPRKFWLWGWAEVTVDGAPTNPADGELVEEVRAVPVAEAVALLSGEGEPWRGELVALAAELRAAARR